MMLVIVKYMLCVVMVVPMMMMCMTSLVVWGTLISNLQNCNNIQESYAQTKGSQLCESEWDGASVFTDHFW
jgi:maltodextrin utilization protein YvdJ